MQIARSINRQVLIHVLILIVFIGAFVFFGFRGVDFGTHWDEHNIVDSVVNALESDNFLPGWYNYPSFPYDLTYVALTRRAAMYITQNLPHELAAVPRFVRGLSSYLDERAKVHEFYLTVRKVFILVSALNVVWMYLLVYKWRKSKLEAALAGALLVGSWEFLYISRWIAADTINAQFGMMVFLCLLLADKSKHWDFWVSMASIAAALALSTKYPGGLLIVPVLAAVLLKRGINRPLKILQALALFVAAFYITSPGVFLQPATAVRDIIIEMRHYATGHGGYTISPGFQFGVLFFTYLFAQVGSHLIPLALIISGFFLYGFGLVVRERSQYGLLMAGFMVLFILYFSTQHVLTVRNLMMVVPIFMIFAAHGIVTVFRLIPWRLARIPFAVAIAAILVYNYGWQLYTADSVVSGGPDRAAELTHYIKQNPQENFWLSEAAASELPPQTLAKFPNVVTDQADASLFVINSNDVGVKSITYWPANHIDFSVKTIGPYEMNFNYFPSWSGKSRIVILKPKYALPLMPIILAPNP